jgi:hypothetical protein
MDECNICGYYVDDDGNGHYESDSDPGDYCRAR